MVVPYSHAMRKILIFLALTVAAIVDGGFILADDATDAKIFFADYPAVAAKAKAGNARDAMVEMDSTIAKISASPWKEIALFKKSQLAESVDAGIARIGYQTVQDRLKNNAVSSPTLLSTLTEGSRRALRRLQLADVTAALEMYYKKRVEYPETLQVLADKKLLPSAKLRDDAGQPISYKVMTNPAAPKIPRQRYSLDVPPVKPFAPRAAAIAIG